MKNISVTITAAIASVLLLQSCAVKKCVEPQLDIPETIIPGTYADSLCFADMKWTEVLQDTILQGLVNKALEHNRDMLSAAARVKELERLHRVARADQFPSIGANAYAEREVYDYSQADKVIDPEIGLKATFSWEVDFFGKLRWANRGAMAEYLASIEAQRAIQMTIIANVAKAYFELIALDNELEIVLRTLDTRKENTRQAKLRFDGGLTTEIPYQQAQVEFATTASLVPDLKKEIEIKQNEISLLTGEFPGEIRRSLFDNHRRFSGTAPVGIPSGLMRRRPDLKASEQNLKAAMAEVGVAWADRFPKFVISLQGGLENNTFSQFFTTPFTYVAGELTSPLFSFGKRKAKYEASIQAYEQARFKYEQKVMEVFKEVNDAVTAFNSSREKVELMKNLKEASRKYVDLALFRYQNGYVNYIDVLDAQRSYFNAEIDLTNAVRDEFISMIDLYKALGGGWE